MGQITVVGCGVMGSQLANAFLNGGNDVVIVDLNKAAADPLIAKGAAYAPSIAEAPETDIIFVLMPNHSIAKKILAACPKERLEGKMLINGTTCGPTDVADMAELTKEIGMKYLEIKLEMAPPQVGRDTGYTLLSGDKEVFDATESMLRELGEYTYLGENVKAASCIDIAFLDAYYGYHTAIIEGAAFLTKNGVNPILLKEPLFKSIGVVMETNFNVLEAELGNYNGCFPDTADSCGGPEMWIERRGEVMVKDAMNACGVNTIFADWMIEKFDEIIADGYEHKNMVALASKMIDLDSIKKV